MYCKMLYSSQGGDIMSEVLISLTQQQQQNLLIFLSKTPLTGLESFEFCSIYQAVRNGKTEQEIKESLE